MRLKRFGPTFSRRVFSVASYRKFKLPTKGFGAFLLRERNVALDRGCAESKKRKRFVSPKTDALYGQQEIH